jgi:WD40 repeat protein
MSTLLASASQVVKTFEYQADNGLLRLQTTCDGLGGDISSLSWNHTNQVLAVGVNRKITLIQARNGQFLSSIPFQDNSSLITDKISSLAFSGTSRYLANSSGSLIYIWDLKKRNLKSTLPGGTGAITCLHLSSDGTHCASGDLSGTIRLWDIKQTKYHDLIQHCNGDTNLLTGEREKIHEPVWTIDKPASHLVSSPRLGSGDGNGFLTLWDITKHSHILNKKIHNDSISCCAFSPKNGRLISTCGRDGKLCLVDTGISGMWYIVISSLTYP